MKKVFFVALLLTAVFGLAPSALAQAPIASTLQNLTLTSPNGGELWERGKTYNITWTSSGINQITVQVYNYSGTLASSTIGLRQTVSAAAGSYSWTIPADAAVSDKYRVVIFSMDGFYMQDSSNNYFSIIQPGAQAASVNLVSPNGGEQLVRGTPYNVAWTSSGISQVAISLFEYSGVIPKMIGQRQLVPASTGSYSLMVPADAPISTKYKLLISNAEGGLAQDISNTYFSVADAATPWCFDFNLNIGFSSSGTKDVINLHTALTKQGISFAPDTGSTYSNATSYAVSTFQLKYGITQTGYVGPLTRAKLNELYGCTPSTSRPSLTLNTPNSGESLIRGGSTNIAFTFVGIPKVDFKITLKDFTNLSAPKTQEIGTIPVMPGSTWDFATTSYAQRFYIGPDFLMGNKYQICVTSGVNSYAGVTVPLSDCSDNYFSIVEPTAEQKAKCSDSDNGKDYFKKGTIQFRDPVISKTDLCVDNTKLREYFCDLNWQPTYSGPSWFCWGFGDCAKTDGFSLTGNDYNAYNDYICLNGCIDGACLPITPPPPPPPPTNASITVTSPNGGETFIQGQAYNITWTSANLLPTDNIEIYYTYETTSAKTSIGSATGNVNFYSWTVPGNMGALRYKINVEARRNGAVIASDTSDDYFSFPARTITILSPNGGESWQSDARQTVRWINSEIFALPVTVNINLINSTGGVTSVLTERVSYGTAPTQREITVPASLAVGLYDVEVKMTLNNGQVVLDKSDGKVNITGQASIYCTDSDGGINYFVKGTLETNTPYWFSPISDFCVDGLNLQEYSCNATAPTFQSRICLNGCLNGVCNPEAAPSITVTAPALNSEWAKGTKQTITWRSSGLRSDKVKIELVNPTTLAVESIISAGAVISVPSVGGSFEWTLPVGVAAVATGNHKILVSQVVEGVDVKGYSEVFKITDASISPTVTIISPNGGQPDGGEYWMKGQRQTVKWNFSKAPVAPVTRIINLIGETSGRMTLATDVLYSIQNEAGVIVPAVPAGKYKIEVRIVSSNGNIIFDQSDNYFKIVEPNYPSIRITSPASGESWPMWETRPINWTASNIPNTHMIDMSLVDSSGADTPIKAVAASPGSFSWFVNSGGRTGNFKIKMVYSGGPYGNAEALSPVFNISAGDPRNCPTEWQCDEWGDCIAGQQKRTCADVNNCGVTTGKPAETQTCTCIPSWQTGPWGVCGGGTQRRVVSDAFNCGVTTGKPAETQTCACDPDWMCSNWSACDINNKQTRSCVDSNDCGVTTGKPAIVKNCGAVCAPQWICAPWSDCIAPDYQQTRTCRDSNNCGVATGKPLELQTCGDSGCRSNWVCGNWTLCRGGYQSRTCTDSNNCRTATNKPAVWKTCTSTCTPNWTCTGWGACNNSQQTRTCTDSNRCGITTGKPAESQTCSSGCTPNWTCGTWGACLNNSQTRTCTDSRNCGTTTGKPAETQTCSSSCTPNWNCSTWGACSNNQQTRICTDSNNCGITTGKPAETQTCSSSCTENWTCTAWGACNNSIQTRTCTDSNNCGTTSAKPNEAQGCGFSSFSCYFAPGTTSNDNCTCYLVLNRNVAYCICGAASGTRTPCSCTQTGEVYRCAASTSTASTSSSEMTGTFLRPSFETIGYASSGSIQVDFLHSALEEEGISYAPDAGNVYNAGTAAGVTKFQEKYASEILTPSGLTKGTGYVGPATKSKLNQLYGPENSCPKPAGSQYCKIGKCERVETPGLNILCLYGLAPYNTGGHIDMYYSDLPAKLSQVGKVLPQQTCRCGWASDSFTNWNNTGCPASSAVCNFSNVPSFLSRFSFADYCQGSTVIDPWEWGSRIAKGESFFTALENTKQNQKLIRLVASERECINEMVDEYYIGGREGAQSWMCPGYKYRRNPNNSQEWQKFVGGVWTSNFSWNATRTCK